MKYFTVGPTHPYPTLAHHLQTALEEQIIARSHRGPFFADLTTSVQTHLRQVMAIPDTHRIYYLASANEAWERIIQNCVERSSSHYINGSFGKSFAEVARRLDRTPHLLTPVKGELVHLKIPADSELIAFTHNESSTGILLDLQEVYAVKKAHPDKLVALDVVSSAPCYEMNFHYLDLVYFSVQKGFGLPAGLCILIVSPQAYAKSEALTARGLSLGSYHSFPILETYALKQQTPETPNTLALYLLDRVCIDLLACGMRQVREDMDQKYMLLERAITSHPLLSFAVPDPSDRSHTVIVVAVKGGSAPLINKLAAEGYEVTRGYGDQGEAQIRIGNFPSHSLSDVKGFVSTLQKIS